MLGLQRQDFPVALNRLGHPALGGCLGRAAVQTVGRRLVGFRLGVDQVVLRNRRGEGPQRELLVRTIGNGIGLESPGAEEIVNHLFPAGWRGIGECGAWRTRIEDG